MKGLKFKMIPVESSLRDISGEEYVSTLIDRSSVESYPLACSMDITELCNLECVHCFLGTRRESGGGNIAKKLALQILDILKDAGVLALVITGGEPLAHPDFRELWIEAKQRGFLLTLFTNATLMDDELASFLADNPPRRVEVSVYGYTEKTYESITGIPGSYNAFIKGVECLNRAGINLHLKFPVMTKNYKELEDVKKWAEKMGVELRYDMMVSPTIDGGLGPLAYRLLPAKAAELWRVEGGEDISSDECALSALNSGSDLLVECGAGVQTVHIDVEGNMHPCILWRDMQQSILETTAEQWNRQMHDIRLRSLSDDSNCLGCSSRSGCLSCYALSVLETGEAGAVVDYFCDLMHEKTR